jgi:hypothetical protein
MGFGATGVIAPGGDDLDRCLAEFFAGVADGREYFDKASGVAD